MIVASQSFGPEYFLSYLYMIESLTEDCSDYPAIYLTKKKEAYFYERELKNQSKTSFYQIEFFDHKDDEYLQIKAFHV